MATGIPIKVVDIGGYIHELLAKYIQDGNGNPKTWADIEAAAAEAGVSFKSLSVLPTADATAYATYRKTVVFIPSSNPGTQNIKDEYIIQRDGEEGSYTYRWEQIGSTEVDLSDYLQKGVTYIAAAQSNGDHSHTVTVPTISVDKTNKLGATASTPTVTPSTSSASKATAATSIAVPQKTFTDVNATNIATPDVVTVKQVNTVTSGTAASFTQGAKAAWSASVDNDGVLSFSFTENGNDTFVANTPTAVSTTDVTGVVKSGAATPSATAVTASKAANGVDISIPQYTFSDVTVVTGVAVSAPTITITESTTNTGPVNEHTTTSTASATTSTTGAHTHNVNVPE